MLGKMFVNFLQNELDQPTIAGIQSNTTWTQMERRKWERFWIRAVGNRHSGSLNMKP